MRRRRGGRARVDDRAVVTEVTSLHGILGTRGVQALGAGRLRSAVTGLTPTMPSRPLRGADRLRSEMPAAVAAVQLVPLARPDLMDEVPDDVLGIPRVQVRVRVAFLRERCWC